MLRAGFYHSSIGMDPGMQMVAALALLQELRVKTFGESLYTIFSTWFGIMQSLCTGSRAGVAALVFSFSWKCRRIALA